ncbi:MAG: Peptide deformylase [Candidatus Saccharibacteria bacterium]|nr:Peptide deformylase [Candidatus Saccharibacteria bacterium]
MPEILNSTYFGNPILREQAKRLTRDEILSDEVQTLIDNMYFTLKEKSLGVGLAAPQVGARIALSVLGIKPTPTRPNLEPFSTVLINPIVAETFGNREQMWEGCVSSGEGDSTLYAKVPRYKKIRLQWLDENALEHDEVLEGFVAHVAQHETDHLNGILFVDHVKDTKSYMLATEYKKLILGK